MKHILIYLLIFSLLMSSCNKPVENNCDPTKFVTCELITHYVQYCPPDSTRIITTLRDTSLRDECDAEDLINTINNINNENPQDIPIECHCWE